MGAAMMRKIVAMHKLFGTSPGKCSECDHFTVQAWRSRVYFKCEAYSTSCSEASDWRKYYPVCGLFNKPIPTGFVLVLERLKHEPRGMPEQPLEGQIEMEV